MNRVTTTASQASAYWSFPYSPCILFLSLFFPPIFAHLVLKSIIDSKSNASLFIVSMPMLILCPFYIQVDDYSSRVFKAELSSAVLEEEWVVHAMKITMANQHELMDMMTRTWRVQNEINTSSKHFYLETRLLSCCGANFQRWSVSWWKRKTMIGWSLKYVSVVGGGRLE